MPVINLLSVEKVAARLGISDRRVLLIGRASFAAHKLRREHAIDGAALIEVKVYGEAGRPPMTQKKEGRIKTSAIAIAKQKGGRK